MFVTLLIVTFIIALIVSYVAARFFNRPVLAILKRIVAEELSYAWHRYIKFAIYVVGISGGVRIWDLEKYITPQSKEGVPIILNADRWILELYRTVISTLQSITWMLLVFFVFSLIAFVVVKGAELKVERNKQQS